VSYREDEEGSQQVRLLGDRQTDHTRLFGRGGSAMFAAKPCTRVVATASAAAIVLLAVPALSPAGGPAAGHARSEDAAVSASAVSLQEEPDGVPSLDAILARYVLAVGGRDALLNLGTRVATLRCITDLTSRKVPVYEVDSLAVWSRATGEFRVVHRTPGSVLIEGFDGKEGWKIENGGERAFGLSWGPRDLWLTDPRFPLHLAELFSDMTLVGLDVWNGEWLYVVDVDNDDSHRLGFDVDTGLLTRLGYYRELRDYAEVDGVLMPMRVLESRKGGSSTFIFDRVSHNEEIDPRVFAPAK
jgi:hypothetical protein